MLVKQEKSEKETHTLRGKKKTPVVKEMSISLAGLNGGGLCLYVLLLLGLFLSAGGSA